MRNLHEGKCHKENQKKNERKIFIHHKGSFSLIDNAPKLNKKTTGKKTQMALQYEIKKS